MLNWRDCNIKYKPNKGKLGKRRELESLSIFRVEEIRRKSKSLKYKYKDYGRKIDNYSRNNIS